MKTILISGKSGSGKDAFATLLKEKLEQEQNAKILTIHFADLVKIYAEKYYNWNGIKDEAGRSLLQHLGTDTVRKVFPDYWAECVAKFIYAVREDFDYTLIPDARFPNEIEVVKRIAVPAFSVRLTRYNTDGSVYLNPLFTKEQLKHPSEVSLDDWKWFDYKYSILEGMEFLKLAVNNFYNKIIGE